MWDYYDVLDGRENLAAMPVVEMIMEEADGNYLRFGSVGQSGPP